MLWDERDAVQRASLTPSSGLPVAFGMEAITGGFDFTRGEETSTSLERALWEEYDSYLDQVEQRTGQRIENPIGFAPRAHRPGMTGQLKRQQESEPSTGMQAFDTRIAELRQKDPELPTPPTAGQLLDRITGRLGAERAKYEDLRSRMTVGGSVANFIGSAGGILTDPLVAATLPFGAGAGRPLVAKMLVEAGIAGASELAVQPYIMRGKEAIQSPYTFGDAAENVLAAAGLGAAFPAAAALLHAGGSAAVRRLARAFDPDRPAVLRPATTTERAALDDAERAAMTEEASPLAPADLPAHVERVDNEAAALRETGEIPPAVAAPEPVRLAEVEAASRLDDMTQAEIGALAKEDADLGRAMGVMESVRSATRPEARMAEQPTQFEGMPERIAPDAEFVRGVAESEPFASQGFRGLDVPTQSEMLASMVRTAQDPEVLKAIVRLLPVDVMDFLKRQKLSPEMAFHNEAMLADLFAAAADKDVAGSVDVLTAFTDAVARATTVDESAILGPGVSAERSAASGALDDRFHKEDITGLGQDYKSAERRPAEPSSLLGEPASWVIVDKNTGKPVMETFERKTAEAVNTERYRAVPILDHLRNLNREINGQPVSHPADAAKELAEFTGSKAEDAALTADVERALGAKAPPEPAPDAPKPAELPKPVLDPELAKLEVPVAEAADGVETRTAGQLLDELEREQRGLDAMSSCAAPLPMPKGPKA